MPKGECNCGAVAFEITSNVSEVFICHCSICQKATGNNGIAVVIVDNDSFRWVTGKTLVKTWHKPGHDWQTSFCQNCGSTLPGKNDDAHMYVPAGLIIEGNANLIVTHHIWVSSKAAWDEIADSGTQHQQAFGS